MRALRRRLATYLSLCLCPGLGLGLGLSLGLAMTACDVGPKTGELRVTYLLQDTHGDELDCQAAGVVAVRLRLYASRQDTAPVFEVSVDCSVDESGEGQAGGEYDVGFFDSAQVALLAPDGEVAVMANGAPARWEFLTLELTGGGVTDLLPLVTAVFDASALQ